jgi:hypothetical protein
VTNNRSCDKKDFNWSVYHKPKRILSGSQELALSEGLLRPLLDYVLSHPEVRLDIRHHKANLYYRGGNLLRLASEGVLHGVRHFGEFDLNYSVPKGAKRLAGNVHTLALNTRADVDACVSELDRFKEQMLTWWADYPKGERTYEQYIASANESYDPNLPPEYLVIDLEYQYARRRFDLVAMKRNPTTSDPIGFQEPQLSLWELKCDQRALSGKAGLLDHAVDYRQFVLAEPDVHVRRAQDEYAKVVLQKQRLGLFPDCGFTKFSPGTPEFLLLFADYAVGQRALDRPLEDFTTCLEVAGLLEHVAFTSIPRTGERFEEDLTVGPPMTAAEFRNYRTL